MTDWNLIKSQYEVLGKSVQELIDSHNVDPDLLQHAITSQKWSAPTLAAAPADGSHGDVVDEALSEIESLNTRAANLQAKHDVDLIPRYIAIETKFLNRLSDIVGNFNEPGEAKAIADTLAVLKPAIMKKADVKTGDKGAGGGMRIAIVNKFATPQPGDDDYIAPNAVVLGDHARQHNGITSAGDVGTDYTCIEIEVPLDGEVLN